MAIFILTARSKEIAQVETDAATFGSASACTFSLEDPLLAEAHCVVEGKEGGFFIRDLETSTGTFVAGLPVEEGGVQLQDGVEIVIGVSRLRVTLDSMNQTLSLELKERGFHYDGKRDPMEWAKTEVSFGRFAPVRWGNRVSLGVIFGLLILFTVRGSREWIMEPGELLAAHHQEALVASGDQARALDGCHTCHDPFRGVTNEKCGGCHEEILDQNQHPFAKDPEAWERQCRECHQDHRGADGGGTLRSLVARPAEVSCNQFCHDHPFPRDITRDIAPLAERSVHIAYDGFSHADHLSPQGRDPVPCGACHVAAESATPESDTTPRREFLPVLYETCLGCHGDDAEKRRGGQPQELLSSSTYRATWHGSEEPEKCTSCHTKLHVGDLAKEQRFPDARVLFDFPARPHSRELENDPDCRRCHVDSSTLATARKDEVFRHQTHLSRLEVDEPVEARKISQEECLPCHTEQREATGLSVEPYRGPPADPGPCVRCHRDAAGESLTPKARVTERGEPRSGERFPHAPHIGLPGEESMGCFECHYFEDQDGGGMVTDEDIRNCTGCHSGHEKIAGGQCGDCHGRAPNVYTRTPFVRQWPNNRAFRHFTGTHGEETRAGRCQTCHEGTQLAGSVTGVPIPSEHSQPCRSCHVEKRARFHWR